MKLILQVLLAARVGPVEPTPVAALGAAPSTAVADVKTTVTPRRRKGVRPDARRNRNAFTWPGVRPITMRLAAVGAAVTKTDQGARRSFGVPRADPPRAADDTQPAEAQDGPTVPVLPATSTTAGTNPRVPYPLAVVQTSQEETGVVSADAARSHLRPRPIPTHSRPPTIA